MPEDFAQKLIDYENSIFKDPDEGDGMGFCASDSFESHAGARHYRPKIMKDFDNANPTESLKKIMNGLIAHASENQLGVRQRSWAFRTFGPSDEIEAYNDSVTFEYKGADSYGSSGLTSDTKNCRDRFIQARLSFGHVENISFFYSWDITYDVIDQRATVFSYISYSQPVFAEDHAAELVNLIVK